MKNILTFASLMILIIFSSKPSLAQKDSYIGVWNYAGKCIYFEKGDTNAIDTVISKINIGKDSVVLMYIGSEIESRESFHPAVTDFCIEYDVFGTLLLYPIFPHNDSLANGHILENDTLAINYNLQYRDHLSDGVWIRVVHDSNGVYKQEKKSIVKGFLDGEEIVWHPNGMKSTCSKVKNGHVVEYYTWNVNGCLVEKGICHNNILIEKYSFSSCDGCINYYYNYNWGYISFYEGKISLTGRVYKGVNHGDFFEFDSNGNIIDHKSYFYGKEVK